MHPRFLSFALVALLVIGLLVFGGSAMQRNAWTQGYLMGQAAANGDGNAAAALAPYMARPGFGGPGLGLLACLLPLGFLAFLVFVVGGFFRHKAWQGAGGPPDHWRRQWKHGAGSWCQGIGKATEPAAPVVAPEPGPPAPSPEALDPTR